MKTPYDREHFFATIIGGGPAGASCGLWLKHLDVPSMLFEKEPALGGLQRKVPDPLSNHYLVSSAGMRAQQIAESIHENLARHGVHFVTQAEVTSVVDDGEWFHIRSATANGSYEIASKNIVLASGVQFKREKFVPSSTVFIGSGNDEVRVESNRFFEGKHVAILGGGDNAMETYEYISAQNPKELLVFARNLRASKSRSSKVNHEHILGLDGGYDVFVNRGPHGTHLITTRDDPFSRYSFHYLVVNYGFEAIRVLPESLDPQRTERGFIQVDDSCQTSNPRIFAIGESTQRMHPCVATAMADGVVAAKALEKKFAAEM